MKIDYFRYFLTPVSSIGAIANANPRKGALLKIEWTNGLVGYSDCFPWTELGDLDLDGQLKGLQQGRITSVMEQSIWLARRDAEQRGNAKGAFSGLPKIKNHYLVQDYLKFPNEEIDNLRKIGYTTIKFKFGRDIEAEAKWLEAFLKKYSFSVRLDFNSKLNYAKFVKFCEVLSPASKSKIEFVEDPFPWNYEDWLMAANFLPLALDHEFDSFKRDPIERDSAPFKIVIVKPARQNLDKVMEVVNRFGLKFVVTNCLEHVIGQLQALALASDLKKKYPNQMLDPGCLSLNVYEKYEFLDLIPNKGPIYEPRTEGGIGFDEVLKRQRWKPVNY